VVDFLPWIFHGDGCWRKPVRGSPRVLDSFPLFPPSQMRTFCVSMGSRLFFFSDHIYAPPVFFCFAPRVSGFPLFLQGLCVVPIRSVEGSIPGEQHPPIPRVAGRLPDLRAPLCSFTAATTRPQMHFLSRFPYALSFLVSPTFHFFPVSRERFLVRLRRYFLVYPFHLYRVVLANCAR